MIISKENATNKNKNCPSENVGFLKMKVISNLKTETINRKTEKVIASITAVITAASIVNHMALKVNKAAVNKILP